MVVVAAAQNSASSMLTDHGANQQRGKKSISQKPSAENRKQKGERLAGYFFYREIG